MLHIVAGPPKGLAHAKVKISPCSLLRDGAEGSFLWNLSRERRPSLGKECLVSPFARLQSA